MNKDNQKLAELVIKYNHGKCGLSEFWCNQSYPEQKIQFKEFTGKVVLFINNKGEDLTVNNLLYRKGSNGFYEFVVLDQNTDMLYWPWCGYDVPPTRILILEHNNEKAETIVIKDIDPIEAYDRAMKPLRII